MLDYQKERSPSRRSYQSRVGAPDYRTKVKDKRTEEENVDTRGSTLVLKEINQEMERLSRYADGKATTKKFVASVFNTVM